MRPQKRTPTQRLALLDQPSRTSSLHFITVRLPTQTGYMLSSQEILLAESSLVEVYKDGLDVSLGNKLEQFVDFVIAFKGEQAEDVSRYNFM